MANVSHITVSGTTYDIAPASVYGNYSQSTYPVTLTENTNAPTFNFLDSSNTYAYFYFYHSGTTGSGIYKTQDFKTWTLLLSQSSEISKFHVSADNTIMYYIYGSNVYVSRNSGSSFTSIAFPSGYGTNYGGGIANNQIILAFGSSTTNSYLYYVTSSNALYATNQQCFMSLYSEKLFFYTNSHYYIDCRVGSEHCILASKNTTLQASYPFVSVASDFYLLGVYGNFAYGWYSSGGTTTIAKFSASSSAVTATSIRYFNRGLYTSANTGRGLITTDGKILIDGSYNQSLDTNSIWIYDLSIQNKPILWGNGPSFYNKSIGSLFSVGTKVYTTFNHNVWTIDTNTASIITGV